MNLTALQNSFFDNLYNKSNDFCNQINPHPLLSNHIQYDIYRDSIFERFQKSLKAIYPVCFRLVGEAFFRQLSQAYIERTPSSFFDLNLYGNDFPSFIKNHSCVENIEYLPDIASLEWAWHQLYGAPKIPPLDPNKLTEYFGQKKDQICFLIPPFSSLLTSVFPVDKIWEANQLAENSETIYLDNNRRYFFIWNDNESFYISNVQYVEYQSLNWIKAGYSLFKIHENMQKEFPETPIDSLLPEFVKKKWIIDCF